MSRRVILAAAFAVLVGQPLSAHEGDAAGAGQGGKSQFGKVHFPTSCSPAVQGQFERAVAMLHSFFYPADVKAFEAVIQDDPQCAMAYWGLAVSTRPNPLVGPFDAATLKRGLDAVEKVCWHPADTQQSNHRSRLFESNLRLCAHFESMLLRDPPKIFFRQHRPEADSTL